jgi:hypothetical protein
MNKKTKAQGLIEYVALVLIVSAALTTILFYIYRTIEVRTRHLNQELNESQRGNGLI